MMTCFRAEASCSRLAELNPYVLLTALPSELNMESDLSYLTKYQVKFHKVSSNISPVSLIQY